MNKLKKMKNMKRIMPGIRKIATLNTRGLRLNNNAKTTLIEKALERENIDIAVLT